MNYKDDEKLPIPPQFSLAKYEPLKKLVTPISWLEQFALRIDLMAHWEKTVRENPDCAPYQWRGRVEENYPEDLLREVFDAPLPNVENFVSSLPYVDFPTVSLVRNCAESIRPMTVLDLITALTLIPPKLRHVMGVFAPQLWSSFLNPANEEADPEQPGIHVLFQQLQAVALRVDYPERYQIARDLGKRFGQKRSVELYALAAARRRVDDDEVILLFREGIHQIHPAVALIEIDVPRLDCLAVRLAHIWIGGVRVDEQNLFPALSQVMNHCH